MCNLYSITTNQAAISALFRVVNRYVGNLAPMPGVFPDYKAPIVRNGAEGRELSTARWGMPSSSKALMDATKKRAEKLQAKGKAVDFKELLKMEPDGGTTNSPGLTWRRLPGGRACPSLCAPDRNGISAITQYSAFLRKQPLRNSCNAPERIGPLNLARDQNPFRTHSARRNADRR
jgi:hypothetical protein